MKLLLLFMLTYVYSFAQHGDLDTIKHKTANLVKKDYKNFRQTNCDYSKYADNKDTKDLFCKANYFFSIKEYHTSIDCLKQAYTKSISADTKFQILKLVSDNYRQLGDNKHADIYQEKANQFIDKNPNIQK